MKKVSYDRGRIIDAPAEVVACLWTNWEIYDALLGGKFNIARTGPTTWSGKHVFSANVELVSREARLDVGKFVYIFSANLAGLPGKAVVTLRYAASLSGGTSVEGRFENELKWPYTIAEPFVKNQITRAVDAVIEGGQVSCERISKDYELVKRELPHEYIDTIDSYLDTAKRMRQHAFTNPLLSPPSATGASEIIELDHPDLGRIRSAINELRPEGGHERLIAELEGLVTTHGNVPKLTFARRSLEVIIIELCEAKLKRPRGRDPLERVLDQLGKFIPENVFASMKNVNRMGRFGAHPGDFSPSQVREAFVSLSSVLEWYLEQLHKASNETDNEHI